MYIEGQVRTPKVSWAPETTDGPRRFYRTGDTGFVDANGLFTSKGRTDLLVRIRGQRIELGEVESSQS